MYLATKKGQYALLMGLAGAIRRLTRVEDSVHALANYVGDRAVATDVDGLDTEPGPGANDRETLLVLAVEFEAAAHKVAQRSNRHEVHPLRSNRSRHSARNDVSRETREDDAPDTER